ncbi:hypothetical protein FQA39_LY19104 [Lamprigera yunnana]|nr:hypothetical protein FQA39_LY19104 [Lamprigera yunnana]
MFMDALAASATTKKEPKKRKRRASVSKDSMGPSPPPSPSSNAGVTNLKNLSPPKFYQDTLETEEPKPEAESAEPGSNTDEVVGENAPMDTSDRVPSPTVPINKEESVAEEEEQPVTRVNNGLKGVLVHGKRKGVKKSIKWKPDDELVDIQYFELDETERVNVTKTFGDMAKMDVRGEREALQMSRKLPNEDVMDAHTIWRIPYEVDLTEPLAEPGCKSLEKDIQFAREKSVLQAIYFNKKMLPESPAEPDPEMYQVKDAIVIPIDAADNPDHDFRDTHGQNLSAGSFWMIRKMTPEGSNLLKSNILGGTVNGSLEITYKQWLFRVRAPDLRAGETVCVTGDVKELGTWSPEQCVPLDQEDDSEIWSKLISIPDKQEVCYRYCVCVVIEKGLQVIVKNWEPNLESRIISVDEKSYSIDQEPCSYGDIDNNAYRPLSSQLNSTMAEALEESVSTEDSLENPSLLSQKSLVFMTIENDTFQPQDSLVRV